MPSTSTATADAATAASPTEGPNNAQPVHPRPEHHGLVVTGASRWPWYEERPERATDPST